MSTIFAGQRPNKGRAVMPFWSSTLLGGGITVGLGNLVQDTLISVPEQSLIVQNKPPQVGVLNVRSVQGHVDIITWNLQSGVGPAIFYAGIYRTKWDSVNNVFSARDPSNPVDLYSDDWITVDAALLFVPYQPSQTRNAITDFPARFSIDLSFDMDVVLGRGEAIQLAYYASYTQYNNTNPVEFMIAPFFRTFYDVLDVVP